MVRGHFKSILHIPFSFSLPCLKHVGDHGWHHTERHRGVYDNYIAFAVDLQSICMCDRMQKIEDESGAGRLEGLDDGVRYHGDVNKNMSWPP